MIMASITNLFPHSLPPIPAHTHIPSPVAPVARSRFAMSIY